MKDILLISKDSLRRDCLGCYGGRVYDTPNIDRLAKKGTIFTNCWTAAPSTGMSITCMFSGLNAHELLDRKDYTEVEPFTQVPTLFSELEGRGYETHVIWPQRLFNLAWRYSKVFPPGTKVHNLNETGTIIPYPRSRPPGGLPEGIDNRRFIEEVQSILGGGRRPVFIWMHLPYVLRPKPRWGTDTELFDELVGDLMGLFDGDIYLTSDHGHMNCEKGIVGYGFHVYEPAAGVPLITPRIGGRKAIEEPVSLVQLKEIILEGEVHLRRYIYSDTRYYRQPNRRLAIRTGDFKYIYNKKGGSEELYDLSVDPEENINLLIKDWYDRDRKMLFPLEQVCDYRRWSEAAVAYRELRAGKNRMWRTGSALESLIAAVRETVIRNVINRGALKKRKGFTGRWGAVTRTAGS